MGSKLAMSEREPIAVSFGGGVNSTALLWGMEERGLEPDVVLFADTGGERAETYAHVAQVQSWCRDRGWLFVRVTNADPEGERHGHGSLEDECLRNKTLPSLAFGFKGCSVKWKRQPMDRWVRGWDVANGAWGRGDLVQRWLGIDADESHRSANLTQDSRFRYKRPLIDWDWGRDECIEAIERSPFDLPPKSACWFCPAMKKHEVVALAAEEPELFSRAVSMERNAAGGLKSTAGLGRRYSWEELVRADRAQMRLFPEAADTSCGCYDGGAGDE